MLNKPLNNYKTFNSKNFVYASLRENDISEQYIEWLNDIQINRYLEAGKTTQNFHTICNYVNYLRTFSSCDLFTIRYKKDMTHIGNLTITPSLNENTGVYGLMIGLLNQPLGSLAAVESSIAIIDYIFYHLGKEIDVQKVHLSNTRALRLINFLGFTAINSRCNGDSKIFRLTRVDWTDRRKNYERITGIIQVLDQI